MGTMDTFRDTMAREGSMRAPRMLRTRQPRGTTTIRAFRTFSSGEIDAADLLEKEEAADQADVPDGMSIPDELARREARLAKLAEARAKIEARAKERFEQEQAEYEAKMKARAAKEADSCRKPGWQTPAAATGRASAEGPDQSDRRGVAHHAGGRWRV
jgi:hypothetical protein